MKTMTKAVLILAVGAIPMFASGMNWCGGANGCVMPPSWMLAAYSGLAGLVAAGLNLFFAY